jgi:uncharacterized protein (TIGR02231 family)
MLLLMLLGAFPACAAEFGTVVRVLLSPQSAQITAEQEVAIVAGQDGRAEVNFLLPKGSFDISLTAQGRDVEDWSSAKTYSDKPPQAQHERRLALIKELAAAEGEIQAIQARLALWKTGDAKELSFDDLDRRDNKMRQIIPELHVRLHELEEQAKSLRAERDSLPNVGREAVLATASLSGPAKGAVKLVYTWFTNQCSWRPLYRFTALPDRGVALAHLSAEIRQNSGQTWNNAEITLLSHDAGRHAPNTLPPWLVENAADGVPQKRARGGVLRREAYEAMESAMDRAEDEEAPKPAPAIQMTDRDAFASWELGRRALREGTSRLTIREAEWKAAIFRLARPAIGKQAFIAARCTVDDPRAWPAGFANYILDGAAAGSGAFALEGNRAELFFGADPRVTVERETDSRQSGESGIIGKRRNQEWKWTFKAFNGHSKPVLLRVEDAQPQAGDRDIAVSMHRKPEHRLDEHHTLYWELTIPANQGADITHSVTLSAPADMRVIPGR